MRNPAAKRPGKSVLAFFFVVERFELCTKIITERRSALALFLKVRGRVRRIGGIDVLQGQAILRPHGPPK